MVTITFKANGKETVDVFSASVTCERVAACIEKRLSQGYDLISMK